MKTSPRDDNQCQDHTGDPERVERSRSQLGTLLNDETYFTVAETFRALSDSTRVKIVYSLLDQELCTCDLAALIGASESAISQHLRMLRHLRIVKSRREGKLVFYSLDDAHVRVLLMVCLRHTDHGDEDNATMDAIMDIVTADSSSLAD